MSNRLFGKKPSIAELKTYHVGVIEAAAHRALRQHKDELLKSYGVTGMEWYLIGTVADAGQQGIRSSDLAKILGTTMGFLTKTVALLEAKNIVYRNANEADARSNYICLKELYRPVLEEIELALRAKLRQSVYTMVTAEELETYIHVLDKFSQLSER